MQFKQQLGFFNQNLICTVALIVCCNVLVLILQLSFLCSIAELMTKYHCICFVQKLHFVYWVVLLLVSSKSLIHLRCHYCLFYLFPHKTISFASIHLFVVILFFSWLQLVNTGKERAKVSLLFTWAVRIFLYVSFLLHNSTKLLLKSFLLL